MNEEKQTNNNRNDELKPDNKQDNVENEQLSEVQLKKEIRTTRQRLLELIIKKKNQLIVHRIKEKQQQEQLNSNNHMNDLPQPPPFWFIH